MSDLAVESDDPKYPYKSFGVKSTDDPLRLDKGGGFKGTLTYTAEFVSALALKNLAFGEESHPGGRPDGVSVNSKKSLSSIDLQGGTIQVAECSDPVTAPGPDALPHSAGANGGLAGYDVSDTVGTDAAAVQDQEPASDEKREKEQGVEMTVEEALAQRACYLIFGSFFLNSWVIESGIVVFNIISGQLTKKARLEVLLDDGYWPCFSTNKSTSTKAQWGYVGEGFIKEMDFSQVWFRLNEADEGSRDDIIGEWKGDAKAFLEKAIVSCFFYLYNNGSWT